MKSDIEENGTSYDALYMVMISWEEEAKRQKEIIIRLRTIVKKNKENFGKLKEHNQNVTEEIKKLKKVCLDSEKEKQNLKKEYEKAKKRIEKLEKKSKEEVEYSRRELELDD